MAHEIASPVICRLCKEVLLKPAGQVIINPNGGSQNNRLTLFLQKCAEHMSKKHPQVDRGLELQALQFFGLLRLLAYDIKDKELFDQRDLLRWQVHQATLAGRLTDEALEARSKELAEEFFNRCVDTWTEPGNETQRAVTTAGIQARLIEVFKGYREIVEEPGRYPAAVIQTPA